MSVANLDIENLASFAAVVVENKLAELAEVLGLLATVSAANSAALADQYGDIVEPIDAATIGMAVLDILGGKADAGGWPPLHYNCITNAGRDYLPDDVADRLRFISEQADRIRDREESRMARAEADAVAFDDVPQLRTIDADGLRQAMVVAGADRVIVAKFKVDQSDSQTDYFGSRTSREVVIGLGRGKRESFAQLRKAAAAFKPTADYGPGRGRWYASAVLGSDCRGNGCFLYAGGRSPWHSEDHAGPFPTRAAAEAYTAGKHLDAVTVDGVTVPIVWQITDEPIEHRENYSMGGGNYLGDSRYGGWTVSSSTYAPASAEVFSLAAFGGKPTRK